jgi:hypothetical protein
MITNRGFIVALAFCVVLYFVSDYFFNGAVFYLIGGSLGAVLKLIDLKNGFYLTWTTLLVGSIVLFYKSQNKAIKYTAVVIIWALLYLIDSILYEVMPDITSKIIRYSHMGLAIFLKSVILILIYYRQRK